MLVHSEPGSLRHEVFFTQVADYQWTVKHIPFHRKSRKLPTALTSSEVKALFSVLKTPKHYAMAAVMYSAGLRITECLNLQIRDIDSENMLLTVREGKGKVYLNYVDRKKKIAKTEELSEELFLRRLLFHVLPPGFKKVRFYGFMANRYRKSRLILCRILLGIPLDEQEAVTMEIPDTAFLFWKYFGVDIFLCRDCGKGHFRFTRCPVPGGG